MNLYLPGKVFVRGRFLATSDNALVLMLVFMVGMLLLAQ